MARIDTFLKLVVVQGGSDLHLISGNPPRLRVHGEIVPVQYRSLTAAETEELLAEILPPAARETLAEKGQVDFSYQAESLARFRVNAFRHAGGLGVVLRVVPEAVHTLAELHLPPVLESLCRMHSGFVLVTGPTGSGKTTTLAAMVDQINRERAVHVITIEQPVEIVHRSRKSLISQREIGRHCASFSGALRSALREDPDVLVVGEMRDLETIRLAVTAAEMGALVLATLHTVGVVATVDRIINAFPAGEQAYIRSMLSTSLTGVASQVLIPRGDGDGRVAAVEVLINNAAAANLIREGRIDQLANVIQAGALQGMQSFDHALRKLVDERLITVEEAYARARDRGHFARLRRALADQREAPPVEKKTP
ncbi:MAG: type IV pilus twitching motility protein PilT [Acidobacteria bacterium]|nr:MAG: type IV pilus twitching motility protein PilT [Acidobacteriota bacterium]